MVRNSKLSANPSGLPTNGHRDDVAAASPRPPHNLELEQAVIGALMIDGCALQEIEFLKPEHFFEPLHGRIFEVESRLIKSGRPATPLSVSASLKGDPPVDRDTTLTQYLGSLVVRAPMTQVTHYARDLVELAVRRAIIVSCEDARGAAYGDAYDNPVVEQLARLQETYKRLQSELASEPLSESRRLGDVESEAVRWLWPERLALGKLGLIAGMPGRGKSQLTCGFAATVTTGGQWPDGSSAPLGSVIFITCEDDAGDTIRPRLEAAGADLSRVHILDWALGLEKGQRKRQHFDIRRHVDALAELVNSIGDVKLIVIDPITAYMGRANSHVTADVRAALAPIQASAAQWNAAVILVSHLNKNPTHTSAMDRVTGAGAFVAVVRSAWLVELDPKDTEKRRRIFAPLKNNLGDDRTGFEYMTEPSSLPNGITTSRVAFGATVAVDADDLLRLPGASNDGSPALAKARAFLRNKLADGPQEANSISDAARKAGISQDALKRARAELGVRSQKDGLGPWRLKLASDQEAEEAEEAEGDG